MSSANLQRALLRLMPMVFVLFWSTGFIVARFGMPHAPPMSFLAWRYGLSLVSFLVWIALCKVPWPASRDQVLHLAVCGVLIHAGYLGGVWTAVKAGMGSGLVALIVGLQPVLTALWLASQGGRVSQRQWAGLVLGLLGLAMVVSGKLGQGLGGAQPNEASLVNIALAIAALLCITGGTLYQKRFVLPCDVRTASFIQILAAQCVTLPLALMDTESMQWHPHMIGALLWSVFALSLGASSLLYMMIQRGAATAVTSLLYLVPPVTAGFAYFLFHEPVTPVMLFGTAVTALGVRCVVVRGASPNSTSKFPN